MYQVKFYKGDYLQRQLAANADKAVAYVEHHFNSSASASANYAVVVVGCSSRCSPATRSRPRRSAARPARRRWRASWPKAFAASSPTAG